MLLQSEDNSDILMDAVGCETGLTSNNDESLHNPFRTTPYYTSYTLQSVEKAQDEYLRKHDC